MYVNLWNHLAAIYIDNYRCVYPIWIGCDILSHSQTKPQFRKYTMIGRNCQTCCPCESWKLDLDFPEWWIMMIGYNMQLLRSNKLGIWSRFQRFRELHNISSYGNLSSWVYRHVSCLSVKLTIWFRFAVMFQSCSHGNVWEILLTKIAIYTYIAVNNMFECLL